MAKLKYGVILGTPLYTMTGGFVASDVLSAKSGRYVIYDISDTYFRAVNDGENKISGYVEESLTCSATAGQSALPIAVNPDQFVCELPYALTGAAATLTEATLKTYKSVLCDIYVVSNIQYADIQTNDNILRVVGGDVAENTLYVMVVNSALNQIA